MKGNAKTGHRTRGKKKRKEEIGHNAFQENETLDLMTLLDKHGCNLKPKESDARKSRLSPSLADIIKDPVALGYFMEFLDGKDMCHFLDFYLAVNAFRSVTQQRAKYFLENTVCKATEQNQLVTNGNDLETNVLCGSNERLHGVAMSSNRNNSCSCLFLNNSQYDHSLGPAISDSSIGISTPDSKCRIACSDHKHPEVLGTFQLSEYWQPFSSAGQSDSNPQEGMRNFTSFDESKNHRHGRPRTKTTILDAVSVYTRYISLNADFPIGVPSEVRQRIEAEICKDRDKVDPACFEEAFRHTEAQLEGLQKEFIHSRAGHTYQWHIVQGKKLILEDVLYNDASIFYFMEFLDQNGFRSVLEFWLMAENFSKNIIEKQVSQSVNINEAVNDAMALYEKYFSMQSKERLIKDDKLRIVLENNICREDGPPPTCFAIPVAYAWTALKDILFPMFQQGDMYRKYLKSLLKSSTRENVNDEGASQSSGSLSGSSNLLANVGESDIDFLDKNPDALWYRPAAGRLALGHVDELGNFVAESEPEPDQDVFKLSKAMRKMLTKKGSTKDKEKEKIALQRARQIIEDIQKCNQ